MQEVIITDQNFKEQILESDKAVLVDFWAPWCGPCKMMGPIIEEVANEIGDKAIVAKLNVDENQNTAETYNIMSIPTIVFFKNGQEVERIIGVRSKDELLAKLKSL